MKVLFWVSPITEMDWPFQKTFWVTNFVPQIAEQLEKVGDVEDQLVCLGEDVARNVESKGVKIVGRSLSFSQAELTRDFSINALEARRNFQAHGTWSDYYAHLMDLFRRKAGDRYAPDVIVSFHESPFLRKLYPDAIHLSVELSVFSRPPYPRTYAFDPLSDGTGTRFLSSVKSMDINSIAASESDVAALGRLREAIVGVLQVNAEISEYFSSLRKAYARVLLVPLVYERYFDTLVNSSYAGQFDLLQHVLEVVGENVCVVLTQHPIVHAIRLERIEELKAVHPNLYYEKWFGSVPNFSQVAMAYVDGCISAVSSLVYQAAFLGKYVISPDGFCGGLADAHAVSETMGVFGSPPKDRDNFFAWILNHYAVEMHDAAGYFATAFPTFRRWRRSLPADFLSEWPLIRPSSTGLSEKVDGWISTTVREYGEELRGRKLAERLYDGSSQAATSQRGADEDLLAQRDGMRKMLAAMGASRAKAREKLAAMTESRDEMRRKLADMESSRVKAREKLAAMTASRDDVRQKLTAVEELRDLAQTRLARAKSVIGELEKDVSVLERIKDVVSED